MDIENYIDSLRTDECWQKLKPLEKIKVEAISRKMLREEKISLLNYKKLLNYPFFLKKFREIGEEETHKLVSELMRKIYLKERIFLLKKN